MTQRPTVPPTAAALLEAAMQAARARRTAPPTAGSPSNGAPTAGSPSNGAPSDGAPSDGAPTDGAPTDGAPSKEEHPRPPSTPPGTTAVPPSGPATNTPVPPAALRTAPPSVRPGARPVIVLVSADEETTDAVAPALERIGELITIRDPSAALALCGGQPPSVVIADAELPRSGGVELLRALRGDALTSRVPTIMLGGPGARDVVAAINAGARHVLTRPLDPTALTARVRSVTR